MTHAIDRISTDKLKPCPFCGSEAHAFETQINGEYQAQAQCKNCGAEIVFWLPWTAGYGDRSRAMDDVSRRWNSRTPDLPDAADPDLAAEVIRLREVVNQCRLAFSGYVSAQSAIDMIDRAALNHKETDNGPA